MLRANRQPALSSMGAATTVRWEMVVIVIILSLHMVIPLHHFQLIHDIHLKMVVVIVIILSLYMVIPLHHFQLIHDIHLKMVVVIVIILSLYMVIPLHLLFGIMGVAPSSLLYKVIL